MSGNTYKQKFVLDADDKTGRAMGSLRKNLGGVDKVFSQLGGNMLGVFGAGALGALVTSTVNKTSESLDKLAKRSHILGQTSSDLDAWDYAAQLTGASTESFESALRRLPSAMYDAKNGSKETADAFEALGVNVTDSDGNLRDVTSVLLDISGGMVGLESSTGRAAVATKILGRSGAQLVNMLQQGPDALRAMLVEAYSMGTRYDELTVKGEDYEDAQLRLNRAWRTGSDVVVGAVLPGLSTLVELMAGKLVDATSDVSQEFREFLGDLQVIPTDTALDEVMRKQEELQGELDKTEQKMVELHNPSRKLKEYLVDIVKGNVYREGVGLKKLEDEAKGLNSELEALEDTKTRLTRRLDLLKKSQKEYAARLGGTREEVTRLSGAERDAIKVTRDSRTANQVFDDTIAKLNDHLIAGRISQETYNLAWERAATALARTNPATKRHNDLMADGARIAADVMTPIEQYNEQLEYLNTLLQENAISQDVYNRAIAAAATEFASSTESVSDFSASAGDSFDVMESAGTTAARGIGNALADMTQMGKAELKDLGDYATQISNQIIGSLIQAGLVDPIVGAITHSGSSSSSAPAGSFIGPPAPSSTAVTTKSVSYLSDGQSNIGATGVTGQVASTQAVATPEQKVEININAIDTAGAVEVLMRHKGQIVGIVQEAYNRNGQRGPLG